MAYPCFRTLNFTGTGGDPDGNALTYTWNLGGAATNSNVQDPGNVVFATVGTYTVTFTVSDGSLSASATRTVTVNAAPLARCTDADNDGYSPTGGACGPIDCNDANSAVNPGVPGAC